MKEKIKSISSSTLHKIDSIFIAIICTDTLRIDDIGSTIATFRKMFPDVMIQGINPSYIYGKRHIFEVIRLFWNLTREKSKFLKK